MDDPCVRKRRLANLMTGMVVPVKRTLLLRVVSAVVSGHFVRRTRFLVEKRKTNHCSQFVHVATL